MTNFTHMQLLTWNLQSGRAYQQWTTLKTRLLPDITFLQECCRPEENDQVLWQAVPRLRTSKNPWGSAVIVSRGTLRHIELQGFEGWVVGGQWLGALNGDKRPIYVFSVHAPTKTSDHPRGSYVAEVNAICESIRKLLPVDASLLLGGDFNFTLGQRAEGETLKKTKKSEIQALANIESLGVKSCWLTCHPGQPLAQTLSWSGNPKAAYHCDGLFAPPGWLENSLCEVFTAPWQKSDHKPMSAWVTPSSPIQNN